MKIKKIQFIALLLAVFALAGLGCKKTDNANQNINNAAIDNKNVAVNGSNANISNINASNRRPSKREYCKFPASNRGEPREKRCGKIARFFTEFFGSFSTDSNYGNVTGLKIYMTQSMQKWADSFVADAKKNKNNAAGYFGVTTKAVSVKTDSFSEEQGKAEVTVSCQRREATGTSTNARIYYQDITVSFVKEKGVWKVNEAKWK